MAMCMQSMKIESSFRTATFDSFQYKKMHLHIYLSTDRYGTQTLSAATALHAIAHYLDIDAARPQ